MNTYQLQLFSCLAACTLALPPCSLWAQAPGTLDTSFGNDGIVLTMLDPAADEQFISSVALQADGKILLGGTIVTSDRYALVRYHANGTPDSTFGGAGGMVSRELPASYSPGIFAINPLTNGEIITCGDVIRDNSYYDHLFMCFLPDGNPKTSFGQNGVSILNWSLSDDYMVDAAVRPDGTLLGAGGISERGGEEEWGLKAAVIRCLADGSRDPSFGHDGALTLHPTSGMSVAEAIALQPDGKPVIAGPAWRTLGAFDFPQAFIARCTSDGALDATFGNGGMVMIPSPEETYAHPTDLLILPDGKIMLCGIQDDGLWMARFLANGDHDTSFGASNGEIIISIPNFFVDSSPQIALLPDGGFLSAAGLWREPEIYRLLLLRLHPDGTLDSTFGAPHGYVIHNPAGPGYGFAFADMAMQPDGRVVVAGNRNSAEDPEVSGSILARYYVLRQQQTATPVPPEVFISFADNTISLLVDGTGSKGWTYEVQRSPDLGATLWTVVHTHGPLAADGPASFSFSDPATPAPVFYRVVLRAP